MRWINCASCIVFVMSASNAETEAGQSTTVVAISEMAVPVFEGDLSTPYRVIGPVKDNLRKHFAFQANPTKQQIYAEIWERGKKMGADAVINARYGPTKGSLFNHGSTPVSGTAIKFIDAVK